MGTPPSLLSTVNDTLAIPIFPFDTDPAKIISALFLPRSCFMLCSPNTQRMASDTLLFPLPFGPTIAVMLLILPFGGRKLIVVFLANDLNPCMSTCFRYIVLLISYTIYTCCATICKYMWRVYHALTIGFNYPIL